MPGGKSELWQLQSGGPLAGEVGPSWSYQSRAGGACPAAFEARCLLRRGTAHPCSSHLHWCGALVEGFVFIHNTFSVSRQGRKQHCQPVLCHRLQINWTLTHHLREGRKGKERKGFVLCLIRTLALCKGTKQKEQHQQPCKQWLCFQLMWSELLWEANLLLTHITLELCWKLDVPSTPLLLIYT